MPTAVDRLAPLHPLAIRALVLYGFLRILLTGLSAAAERLGALPPDSPVGTVLLVTLLGAIDVARRGETTLWANLGFSRMMTYGVFTAVAVLGELLIALIRG